VEQITIQGQTFNVPVRYEEGHELTAGEASALNQTYHENIRNNVAVKIRKGETVEQSFVDEYALAYQFGVRASGGGGVSRDPVMSRAMVIARNKIKETLKKMIATPGSKYYGRKISDFTSEAINTAAKDKIAADPTFLDLAKKQIEEERAAATEDLDLSDLAMKEAAQ
jgi:hypothetical protein